MSKCPSCLTDNQNGSKFCINCGNALLGLEIPQIQKNENYPTQTNSGTELLEWYYFINDERIGPVSGSELLRLYRTNKIYISTKVWKAGLFEWIEFSNTELINKENNPPPISGKDINNTFVWILAFVPIIGIVIEYLISGATGIAITSLWIVSVLLNSILCVVDERKLKKAGCATKELLLWAIVLVPVYLFRRAHLLKHKYTYPAVWCVTFAIMLFVPSLITGALGNIDSNAVRDVKNGSLNAYPDKTVGEMVAGYFGNPEWESIVADDGNTYVNISGKILYNEKEINVRLQYKYNTDRTFEFKALEFNEIPQNQLVYTVLMSKMYEDSIIDS